MKAEIYCSTIQPATSNYWLLVLLLPFFLLISCDSTTDMSGAVDNLDTALPPPVAINEGPALSEPSPAPFLPTLGPDHPSSELDKSKAKSFLNELGLPDDGMFFSSSTSTPGKATLSSPSGSINSAAPQFTWQAVSGATWYYVWVRDSGTMDTSGSPRIAHWITASDAGCGSGSGTCSWYADKNLESGDAKWWIRTWNSAGYGPWSSAMDFTVSESVSLPATVTLNSPDSDVSTSRPTFSWNAASGATWYYVWVRDSETMNFSGDPRIKQWVSASQAGCSGGGVCSWEANTDIVDGNATWWVQSWNASGFGGWSSGMNFSVNQASGPAGKATLVSPDGVVDDERPVFEWEPAENTDWYWVWVRDSDTMDFSGDPLIKHWITAEDAGCAGGSGTCSWQADTDVAPGEARFWVQTWNYDEGYGPWSDGMEFMVSFPITGHEVVTEEVTLAGGETYSDAVQCPIGKLAVSGGILVQGAGTSSTPTRVEQSFPYVTNVSIDRFTSYWAEVFTNLAKEELTLTHYATCIDPPAGYEFVTNSFTLSANNFQSSTRICPTGKNIIGGGIAFDPNDNPVTRLEGSIPTSIGGNVYDRWGFAVTNLGNDDISGAHILICANPPRGYEQINSIQSLDSNSFSRRITQCSDTSEKVALTGGVTATGVFNNNNRMDLRMTHNRIGSIGIGNNQWVTGVFNFGNESRNVSQRVVCVDRE